MNMAVLPPKAQMPKWPCPNQAKMLKPLQFTSVSHTLNPRLLTRALITYWSTLQKLQIYNIFRRNYAWHMRAYFNKFGHSTTPEIGVKKCIEVWISITLDSFSSFICKNGNGVEFL